MLLIAVLQANPAMAYQADAGTRAANFRGFDIVNREVVELDDYLGQWVFVEFWATWCGPCMHELPNMLKETKPYVDSGQLKVITVSCDFGEPQTYDLADGPKTVPPSVIKLRQAIREHRITYPVIYDGGIYHEGSRYPTPAIEWGVNGIPASYLINPQGVIVATKLRGDKLAATLDFYINGNRPLMGLCSHYEVNDDSTVSIFAEVLNTGREDVVIELYTYQNRRTVDPENGTSTWETTYADELIDSATVSFDDFCETTHEFVFPYGETMCDLSCYLKAIVPGSEHIEGWDGTGIKLHHDGAQIFYCELEEVDGVFGIRLWELAEYLECHSDE